MASKKKRDITDLPILVSKLPKKEKQLFERFYSLDVSIGKLKHIRGMEKFLNEKFGPLDKVKNQKIIAVYNNFTGEGSLFNELRGLRPKPKIKLDLNFDDKKGCPFCIPFGQTPEDVFGRVKGKYCLTAGNVAKYDQFHGIIIFNEHNPTKLKREWLRDYLEVAEKWFAKVRKEDKKATNLFLMWNCLWRAAASIVHGHMQIMGSRMQYGRLVRYGEIYKEYDQNYNSDYFLDMIKVHKSLGLAKETRKGTILFYLTPVKDREMVIISKKKKFSEMSNLIYAAVNSYFKEGLYSYNMGLYQIDGYWICRLVNRGNLNNRNSDMGGMEIYADSVVASDPFEMADNFKL